MVAEADTCELVVLAAFDEPLVVDAACRLVVAVLEATGRVVLSEARGPAIWT